MLVWAIVPVKPLRLGKSRLAGVLSLEERTNLNRRLLIHTLDALKSTREIEQIIVVSRDPEALSIARERGARTLQEGGMPHLNAALTRATVFVRSSGTHGVLILPADLPLLKPPDIHAVLKLSYDPPVVVIAPDRRRQGTNALLMDPPGLIEYGFGRGSFDRHCERARAAGARLEICELPSLALDVDLPEDLDLVGEELGGLSFEKIS